MGLFTTNFINSLINNFFNFLRKIKFKSLYGFSLYELFRLYLTGLLKGSITTRAGSISFSFFMAFFPFVLFVLNLIPFFPIENFDQIFLDLIESLIPKESSNFFHEIFIDINSKKRTGLLSTTLFLSIILIGNGVNSIFSGFSDSYHIEFSRNFIKQYLYAVMVGLILVLVVLFATIFSIFFDFLITKNIVIISFIFFLLKYVFLILIALVSFSSLYFFGTIQGRNLKFFSPGSVMTTLLLLLSTYFFGVYIDNFSNYNELYGSIGAVIIMMLFIWVNSISLLLGFELNVVIYKMKNN
ncbi:MAG: YihY/virulence factor BrkB family protein [Flavobacteriaceae bacterium]|jgi:membrane protein|nr:YihY/virulence factor BrkB family protein [Flavobacteriaceae bacterium]MDG1974794.1 YihY/virulence factor BrkB family protein [Flavobacteriaceae bacterium]|tara:strand:+ start:517 stop:1410 length:894 start_codon:yes stop_codon:yes gene_type:complete